MAKNQLDPRTKMLLLILVTAVVLGGAGGETMYPFQCILSLLPVGLLLCAGKIQKALTGLTILLLAYAAQIVFIGRIQGIAGFLILFITGIWVKLLPGILMAQYLISTTTVSEFIAAFEKMHIPMQLIIPMSVMFRFFPTVREEFAAIHAAMRMRNISFVHGNVMQAIEYQMVPMLSCSAKIGEELSASALSRGLYGESKRTNICTIGFGVFDYILLGFGGICILYGIGTGIGVIG